MAIDILAYLRKTLPSGKPDDREHIVYWIYDETCIRPGWDGYVGVTIKARFTTRMLEHKRSKRFKNKLVDIKILSRGFAETCYLYEAVLRPHSRIGWNIAPGGSRGHAVGISKSEETKKKIGDANRGNKRPDLSLRNKNCGDRMFPRTCPHCHLTGRGPNMTRYHFNNCKENEETK